MIHAGDFTKYGRISELQDFIEWFQEFPHEHKIFISGNHDRCMTNHKNESLPVNPRQKKRIDDILQEAFFEHDIIYLHNSGKTIDGVTFYGSPYSSTLPDWFFNTEDEENQDIWSRIFDHTDVLITHGPPKGTLDYLGGEWEEHVGDEKLAERKENLDLKAHIFGHIHGNNGSKGSCYNVSVLNEEYELEWKPQIIEIELESSEFNTETNGDTE